MNKRLADLILYVISEYMRRTGLGIGRVRLMKILFLSDYIAYKRRKNKLTGVTWIRWLFGPFSKEVLNTLDELFDKGLIIVEEVYGVGTFYRIAFRRHKIDLPESEKNLINEIISNYGLKYLEDLMNDVYSLPEVKKTKLGDKIL